ncbi:double-stranded RNA binding motif protein [Nitzschia inconspicua]|uniref:Double-stranded RNA binding motif protein n=1 Tax=Nitzschia inconspicua TaxID=303405 RepID=A0A9K3LMB0_9STRA|nr:double-stranded RNA binding motif protein [Nitzschia inconspicua]
MNDGANVRERGVVSDTETVMENLSLEANPNDPVHDPSSNRQPGENGPAVNPNDDRNPGEPNDQGYHVLNQHGGGGNSNLDPGQPFYPPHQPPFLQHFHQYPNLNNPYHHPQAPLPPFQQPSTSPHQYNNNNNNNMMMMSPQWKQQEHQLPPPTGAVLPQQLQHSGSTASQPQGHAGFLQLQYYEAQMRDHAAAYANAAAHAAIAAAHIANSAVSTPSSIPTTQQFALPPNHSMPPALPEPPTLMFHPMYSPQESSSLAFQDLSLSPHNGHADFQQQLSGDAGGNFRRRKRQPRTEDSHNVGGGRHQRRYQNDASDDLVDSSCANEKRGRRRRRFWNDSAGNSSDSTYQNSYHHSKRPIHHNNVTTNLNNPRRRNRKAAMPAASSSSDGGGSASFIIKKKQKQLTDESLLGKTGSGALYEWCDKRRIAPVFECTIITLTAPLEKDIDREHVDDIDGQKPAAQREGDNEDSDKEVEEKQQQEEEDNDDDEEEKKDTPQKRFSRNIAEANVPGIRGAFDQKWYEMSVLIDGIEMGKGRGATKTSAKHEASRNALQVLLPGVQFDVHSGIIIKVPIDHRRSSASRINQWSANAAVQNSGTSSIRSAISSTIKTASSCLDDLAPNLAKRLAIGQKNDDSDDDESKDYGNSDPNNGKKTSSRRGKWPYVYPGTSTTSDDEDANAYFESRGASVCSSLLHAMVQIDDRLSDPPEYTYEISTLSDGGNIGNSQVKRKAGVPIDSSSTCFPRGVFQCTGMLKMRVTNNDLPTDSSQNDPSVPRESFQLLRGVGSGATKREARHVAAAKLLALLFPHCKGMAQVKDAAENAREEYAASRALKQQQSRQAARSSSSQSNPNGFSSRTDDGSLSFNFALASKKTPPMPSSIEVSLATMISGLDEEEVTKLKRDTSATLDESGQMRQLSRQRQLEDKVTAALQVLNEHDEEGRSLPDELTVDDVGRTLLRRANVDDMAWIEDLFGSQPTKSKTSCQSPLNSLRDEKETPPEAMRLWSSSAVVLLLCRAISPYEDPPLGCAVLTLGFSMQNGRVLRLAKLASQPHLPRERFVECLTSFASCMDCFFDATLALESKFTALREDFVQQTLQSHLPSVPVASDRREKVRKEKNPRAYSKMSRPLEDTFAQPALQSVQEEEGEGCEDSDVSQKKNGKGQDKPSKRSRVE